MIPRGAARLRRILCAAAFVRALAVGLIAVMIGLHCARLGLDAPRIGLVNTMVFTHIPSSLLLFTIVASDQLALAAFIRVYPRTACLSAA